MNISKEFVSQVVDEIQRREYQKNIRFSMSTTAYYIDTIDGQIKSLQSKINRLTKRLKWWNKWYLSKHINKYQKQLDKLNGQMALHQRALDLMIRNCEWRVKTS